MAVRIMRELRHLWDEIVTVFANTGQEHPKTLEYVENVARHYGFKCVWVEAVVNPERGAGTGHRIVTPETASRKGEPFEAVIGKYGLPNNQFFHCTRELKLRPITSYLRSIGWEAGSYNSAVGIRFDEMDRISPKSLADGVIYPLIDLGVTKPDVLAWESVQPVRLGIPEHFGNCTWCWRKSDRKLATVARELPGAFAFPERMELAHKDTGPGAGDRRFFRGRKTVADIVAMAMDPNFQPFVDGFDYAGSALDEGQSCGESCEIGVDGPDEFQSELALENHHTP